MPFPDGASRRWESTTLEYSFEVDAIFGWASFDSSFRLVTRLAMDQWEIVSNINFVEVPALDARIGIGFDELGSDGFSNVLGSVRTFDLDGDSILEPDQGDFQLLQMDPFDVDLFFSTMLHELGHVLGLTHNDLQPSVMATFANGALARETIQQADIDVLAALYPSTSTVDSSGDDSIEAQPTSDVLVGGRGHDTILGGDGSDTIYGNKETDLLEGGAGSDTLYGGQNDGPASGTPSAQRDGIETVSGGDGDDLIYGNHGSDILVGGSGADKAYGGQNDDTLRGGAGDDTLFGNLDNDLLSGGAGSDSLIGNGGNDIIYGGDGTDVAVFFGNFSDYSVSISTDFVFVIDNRDGTPDGTDQLFEVETLRFADQDSTVSTSGEDTTSGGGGNDEPTGTDFNVAVNGSIGNPATFTIENFSDGTDKIVLTGFGFTNSGNPSLVTTDGGSFDANGSIVIDRDEANDKIVIYLNGEGSEDYAKVTVTGVTTLDLTDFEFS
jgi:Ca2+-binding RTX toxin-like protein